MEYYHIHIFDITYSTPYYLHIFDISYSTPIYVHSTYYIHIFDITFIVHIIYIYLISPTSTPVGMGTCSPSRLMALLGSLASMSVSVRGCRGRGGGEEEKEEVEEEMEEVEEEVELCHQENMSHIYTYATCICQYHVSCILDTVVYTYICHIYIEISHIM